MHLVVTAIAAANPTDQLESTECECILLVCLVFLESTGSRYLLVLNHWIMIASSNGQALNGSWALGIAVSGSAGCRLHPGPDLGSDF